MLDIAVFKHFVSGVSQHVLSDRIDRTHYSFYPNLLLVAATLLGAKQYFGNPIQCWMPKHYASDWREYIEDFCYIHTTYYVSKTKVHLEPSIDPYAASYSYQEGSPEFVHYYQWVPLFMVLSAVCFHLPGILLAYFTNVDSSIKCAFVVAASQCHKNTEIRAITSDFYFHLAAKGRATSLFVCHVGFKVLACLNLMVQIVHISTFLGHPHFWVLDSISEIATAGADWRKHGMFPRETWCDVEVLDVVNYKKTQVQCVLMINMMNQVIYTALWVLYCCGLFMCLFSLIQRLVNFLGVRELSRIRNLLISSGFLLRRAKVKEDVRIEEFVDFLGHGLDLLPRPFPHADAMLCIDMISSETDKLHAAKIVENLYMQWLMKGEFPVMVKEEKEDDNKQKKNQDNKQAKQDKTKVGAEIALEIMDTKV